MSRNPARLSIALAAAATLSLGGAGAASAWPFGASKPSATPAKASSTASTAPVKASAAQRAAAQRLDPLSRAAFWQHEVTTDPSDVEAGDGLSAALRSLGKYDEAAEVADRVVVLAPKSIDALLESARAHIAGGHGFYALQPLKDAERLAPKDWRPVSLMGVALEQDERPDDALAAYGQALALSPDNPAVLSNMALYYATRGDTARAEMLLRRAAAQPTATAQERQNLALVLGLEGKTAEAEHFLREDLPPESADANLAYFRAGARPAAPFMAPAPAPVMNVQAPARTWTSVQASNAKGG